MSNPLANLSDEDVITRAKALKSQAFAELVKYCEQEYGRALRVGSKTIKLTFEIENDCTTARYVVPVDDPTNFTVGGRTFITARKDS